MKYVELLKNVREAHIKYFVLNIAGELERAYQPGINTDVCNQHRTVRERDMQEKKKNTKSGFSILG